MPSLDRKRFRQDLKAARSGRQAGASPRPNATGAMAVVRDNLALFDTMRAEDPGLTWADIAVSLGQQGVVMRDGQPITAKRLCALISTIRREGEIQAERAEARSRRTDTAPGRVGAPDGVSVASRLTLAPELNKPVDTPAPDRSTEDTIRAGRYAQHDKLFKRKD